MLINFLKNKNFYLLFLKITHSSKKIALAHTPPPKTTLRIRIILQKILIRMRMMTKNNLMIKTLTNTDSLNPPFPTHLPKIKISKISKYLSLSKTNISITIEWKKKNSSLEKLSSSRPTRTKLNFLILLNTILHLLFLQ